MSRISPVDDSTVRLWGKQKKKRCRHAGDGGRRTRGRIRGREKGPSTQQAVRASDVPGPRALTFDWLLGWAVPGGEAPTRSPPGGEFVAFLIGREGAGHITGSPRSRPYHETDEAHIWMPRFKKLIQFPVHGSHRLRYRDGGLQFVHPDLPVADTKRQCDVVRPVKAVWLPSIGWRRRKARRSRASCVLGEWFRSFMTCIISSIR